MNGLEAVILGTIQGLVEWLPISSEAQTMLYMINFLGIQPQEALSYAIFLHLGTMCAVIIAFHRVFVRLLNHITLKDPLFRILALATLCTAVTGIPLYLLLKTFLLAFTGVIVNLFIGVMLILTGIVLKVRGNAGTRECREVRDTDSVIAGLAQGFAIVPGISRSGMTYATLLGRKIEQGTALKISFLISVPAVLGAIIIDARSIVAIPVQTAFLLVASSLVVGYLSMKILLQIAARVSFWIFCLALGAITILFAARVLF